MRKTSTIQLVVAGILVGFALSLYQQMNWSVVPSTHEYDDRLSRRILVENQEYTPTKQQEPIYTIDAVDNPTTQRTEPLPKVTASLSDLNPLTSYNLLQKQKQQAEVFLVDVNLLFYDESALRNTRELYRKNDASVFPIVHTLLEQGFTELLTKRDQDSDFYTSITVLALSFYMTSDVRLADHGCSLLRKVFSQEPAVDVSNGLYYFLDAAKLLKPRMTQKDKEQFQEWLMRYFELLTKAGDHGGEDKNHVGLQYDMQHLSIASYFRMKHRMERVLKGVVARLEVQIARNGTLYYEQFDDERGQLAAIQSWWELSRMSRTIWQATTTPLWGLRNRAICRASSKAIPYYLPRSERRTASVDDIRRFWPSFVASRQNCAMLSKRRIMWKEWTEKSQTGSDDVAKTYNMPKSMLDFPPMLKGSAPFWNLGYPNEGQDSSSSPW